MLKIGDVELGSRLFIGTAQYPSPQVLKSAVLSSGAEVMTLSLRRESAGENRGNRFWDYLKELPVQLLPNTAGCQEVKEAVVTAHLARELFGTHWIKLEVIGNLETLQPDPIKTVEAAGVLVREGFEVFPYITDDLVICERLVEAGCKVVMPWGSPIGTGQGIRDKEGIRAIKRYFPETVVVVDAGIGCPSHACTAMELGVDAVLVNTAIAKAVDPVAMAGAFRGAVVAGRQAFEAGLMVPSKTAVASTPQVGLPFWHQDWA